MSDGPSALERERRASILRDIDRRVAEDGPHVAEARPDRARQFMPFAALRGYGQQVEQVERDLLRDERHELAEEEARLMSERVVSLRRGDQVRLWVYDGGHGGYREVVGRVDEVVVALRRLRVEGVWYEFADLGALDVVCEG
jgi:hypothetical protein